MIPRKISYFSGAFILCCISSHAATLVGISDDTISNYLRIAGKDLASDDKTYKYIFSKKIVLPNGVVKNKYALYYKGVKVLNTDISSTELDGKQMHWFGQMLVNIQQDLFAVRPAFSSDDIIKKVKKNYKLLNSDFLKNERAELLIRMNENSKAELIFLVSFNYYGEEVKRPFFIVNAMTGKIIESWDGLTTRNAEGPGGNQKVGAYYYGKEFGFLDVSEDCIMSNDIVETYDMKNRTTGNGVLHKFTCPINTYKSVNGAYSPLNDAHYFGGVVFDMYKSWYNIKPLDSKLKLAVHYGHRYENAFWDGSEMFFGDGGNRFYPLTGGLDILAHEVSHGVTEKYSDLLYKKQSGGINESFSDMAGETAEYFMNQQVGKDNDWLGGATIMKSEVAMRYFKEPKRDGMSIDNAEDYEDSLDVHLSSGVFNKAFYTLSTKANWGIKKTFGLFLAANQVYWKPESTFDSAACGVVAAAADLDYDQADVISSFAVVGVDAHCKIDNPDSNTDSTELELSNNNTLSNIKISPLEEYRYFIKVPKFNNFPFNYDILQIRVSSAADSAARSAELYIRFEDESFIKIKNKNYLGKDVIFRIRKPNAGTYHILIKAKANDIISINGYYGSLNKLPAN